MKKECHAVTDGEQAGVMERFSSPFGPNTECIRGLRAKNNENKRLGVFMKNRLAVFVMVAGMFIPAPFDLPAAGDL